MADKSEEMGAIESKLNEGACASNEEKAEKREADERFVSRIISYAQSSPNGIKVEVTEPDVVANEKEDEEDDRAGGLLGRLIRAIVDEILRAEIVESTKQMICIQTSHG